MRRLARSWDVLFVEGVPMRSIALGDRAEARRLLEKVRPQRLLRTVEPGLHVLRALPIPPSGRAGRGLQLLALEAQIVRARRKTGMRGPVVTWFSLPTVAGLRGRFGERGSLFYYQDRYELFAHVDAAFISRCVSELARGCEASVATTVELASDLKALGADPTTVPHGVEIARFAQRDLAEPLDLRNLERPLVGYTGLIDDYLAFDHLLAVADRLERGTLVLVGRPNTDVRSLTAHPRIRLLGRRPYEEMPAYLAAFSCCLVPFDGSELSRGVNPIKLREYLAAGRPTVATLIPAVLSYKAVIEIADGADAFANAVQASLEPPNDTVEARARRRARVANEDWDDVVDRIEPVLQWLLAPNRVTV
jgi:glycosyltransferase involved in cell wall biosynthesis